eukprot:1194283-Prorocentrum_minimum.AAC.2
MPRSFMDTRLNSSDSILGRCRSSTSVCRSEWNRPRRSGWGPPTTWPPVRPAAPFVPPARARHDTVKWTVKTLLSHLVSREFD